MGEAVQTPRKGRVLGAVLNYGLGSYVPQLVNFLLVPLYTHYITPAEQGIVEICNATQLVLVFVMRLGMPGALTRYYFELKDGPAFRDMVTTVAMAVTLVAAIVTGLGFLLLPPLLHLAVPEVPFHPFMTIALVTAFLQAAPDLQRRLFAAREQSAASAKLSVANAIVLTGLTFAMVVGLRLGGLGAMWAQLGAAVVFFAVCAWGNRKDLTGRFDRQRLREALAYGLPLVPHHTAAWANGYVGRIVLGAVSTVDAVGQLSLAAKLASPLAIVTGAFSNAYQPVYFAWRSELSRDAALAETRRVGRALVALGALGVIGAAAVGPVVVRHLLNHRYASAAPLVGVIACALFLHLIYTLLTAEIFYSKRTGGISIIFILASLANLGVVVILAPRLGGIGAAVAQLVGGAVSVLIVWRIAAESFPAPVAPRVLVITLGTALAACAFAQLPPPSSAVLDALLGVGVTVLLGGVALVASGAASQLRADLATLRRGKKKKRPAAPASEDVA